MGNPPYTLIYKESLKKDLRKLPLEHRALLLKMIKALSTNPYPSGSVKLQSSLNLHRIRHGEYRIIYQVNNQELLILILKVGHRRDVYRMTLK